METIGKVEPRHKLGNCYLSGRFRVWDRGFGEV